MENFIGKVIEIFIPEEYIKNQLIDIMDRKNIGIKVQIEDEIIEIIEEQNEFNSNIMKDDIVVITKQIIDGKEFTDIELYEGD